MLAAARTWHVVLIDERLHLFLAPAVDGRWQLDAVLRSKIFDELVGTESLFTLLTVHQRIGKTAQMTGSHPCLRVHEDGTVHTYVIRALLNELFPPGALHIVFKLHTQIPVVPCVGQTAVNLGTLIHKPSRLGESDDLIHCLFHDKIPRFSMLSLDTYGALARNNRPVLSFGSALSQSLSILPWICVLFKGFFTIPPTSPPP